VQQADQDDEAVKMEPIQAAEAIDFSAVALFMRSSLTVQVVMVMLIAASFWGWAIIVQKYLVFASRRARGGAVRPRLLVGRAAGRPLRPARRPAQGRVRAHLRGRHDRMAAQPS
jgi:biopolymer transport protein ExbB/TolQ